MPTFRTIARKILPHPNARAVPSPGTIAEYKQRTTTLPGPIERRGVAQKTTRRTKSLDNPRRSKRLMVGSAILICFSERRRRVSQNTFQSSYLLSFTLLFPGFFCFFTKVLIFCWGIYVHIVRVPFWWGMVWSLSIFFFYFFCENH